MKNFYTYLIVALTGGAGYCLIEILYRGRTHYSMFFAGAIVLSSFYYINQKYEMSFWLKCLVGMLIITGFELLFGLIFNIILFKLVSSLTQSKLISLKKSSSF